MNVTELETLHESGTLPAFKGFNDYTHLLYDPVNQYDERVFVTKRDDGSWILQETYAAENRPKSGGFCLVLDKSGQIFNLAPDSSLKEQSRFNLAGLHQLKFYVQTTI